MNLGNVDFGTLQDMPGMTTVCDHPESLGQSKAFESP